MSTRAWLSALGAAFVLYSNAQAQPPAMAVQQEIQTEVTKMLLAIDGLDWRGVRAAFTPQVRVDYTSLFGGSAETLAADTLLARWQGLLPGFDATQHLIGPVIVPRRDGARATAETQARGYHWIAGAEGGALWMAAGRYQFAMEQENKAWRIAAITFQLAYQDGNLSLPQIASTRAAAGQGRARKTTAR